MPPKVKFTKEQVVNAGIELVREKEEISARAIGKKLSSSPQPIFSYFENMEVLKEAVLEEAKKIYWEYIQKGLEEAIPFKGAGMAYIRFAYEEPELFKYLFMTDRGQKIVPHFIFKNGINTSEVLSVFEKNYNISAKKAEKIFDHISVYTHGLAILFAQQSNIYTLEEASEMLSQIFISLMKSDEK